MSTESAGLFTGAIVGTEAYADYVNSQGGVNGRKLVVNGLDDQFTGASNKQQTQNAVDKDFALVGSFSLEDSFGATVLAQNPQVPVVSTLLAPALHTLPNAFDANPSGRGWATGPLDYFKKIYPTQSLHTGVLASTFPSALASWKLEEPVLKQAGYKVTYYTGVPLTQTDFTQNVVDMKSKGVQLIYIDQLPENYAVACSRHSINRTSTRHWLSERRPTARPSCPQPEVPQRSTAATWKCRTPSSWVRMRHRFQPLGHF